MSDYSDYLEQQKQLRVEEITAAKLFTMSQPKIGEVLAAKDKRIAQLERELTETRVIIDKEAKDYAQTYLENAALATQVLQMREALEWADGWIPAKATDEYRQGKDGCTCPMCKALEMSGEYA